MQECLQVYQDRALGLESDSNFVWRLSLTVLVFAHYSGRSPGITNREQTWEIQDTYTESRQKLP